MTPEERACRYLGIRGEKPGWVSIEHDPIVQQLANEIREAIAQARADMREECARVAETWFRSNGEGGKIAAAIRSLPGAQG